MLQRHVVNRFLQILRLVRSSLLQSGVIIACVYIVVRVTFFFFSLLNVQLNSSTYHVLNLAAALGVIGLTFLVMFRYLFETREFRGNPNRFATNKKQKIQLAKQPPIDKVREVLAALGYKDFIVEDEDNASTIQARLPGGVYSYPEIVKGNKYYPEMILQVRLKIDGEVLMSLRPSTWFTPLTVTYSNIYFLDELTKKLDGLA